MAKSGSRPDGRVPGDLRRVRLTRGTMKFADASCLIEWGDTKVICTATVDETVPPFLRGKGTGWVTAEYNMLPRSTAQRVQRERSKLGGRTQEIQRLIGRCLRGVTELAALGERSVIIDCDVIQADGGTRCAAITGGFVALVDALAQLKAKGTLTAVPIRDYVAAVSVGQVDGRSVLDLNYAEDSKAEVDMNLVMTGGGGFVEIQGTAERSPFSTADLTRLLKLGKSGLEKLFTLQRRALHGLL